MDNYYKKQAMSPYFSSYQRQRGSGIGALVAGIGRVALPFARQVLVPAAKRAGRELLKQGIDEIIPVLTKKTVSYTHLTLPTNREV